MVLWPNESTRWTSAFQLYRSGARVAIAPSDSPLPRAMTWLRAIADVPGCEVTLDRDRLTPNGRARVETLLSSTIARAFTRLLVARSHHALSSRWLERHRDSLIAAIHWLYQRDDSPSADLERRLLRWLPFQSQAGWVSIASLREAGVHSVHGLLHRTEDARWFEPLEPGHAAVRWQSPAGREVFKRLAARAQLGAFDWYQGRGVLERDASAPEYPRSALALARHLADALEPHGVHVRLDSAQRTGAQLVRWIQSPSWDGAPSSSWLDADWLIEQTGAPPTLAINPWNPISQSLGRVVTTDEARALGWILAEYASSALTAPHAPRAQKRKTNLLSAICALTGAKPRSTTTPVRCYVTYDWTEHKAEFDAIVETLSAPPFHWHVLDASQQHHDRFILRNILDVMRESDVFVSILARTSKRQYNANVLVEAGVAASMQTRPHLVCHPFTDSLPSNFQGWLSVPYRDCGDLRERLRTEARSQQLHLMGRRPGATASPKPAPATKRAAAPSRRGLLRWGS